MYCFHFFIMKINLKKVFTFYLISPYSITLSLFKHHIMTTLKKVIFILPFFIFYLSLSGQETYYHLNGDKDFRKGIELFRK